MMTPTPEQLTQFLHHHIPASRLLAIDATEATAHTVTLRAPFALNQNHHHTIFGGSGALLATLCAWSLVHLNFPTAQGNIVIQQSTIYYDKPAPNDLLATCVRHDEIPWQKCQTMLTRFNKGRIQVDCTLMSDGQVVGRWQGQFVITINSP